MDASDAPSTRPYLIRALFDWCTDSGYTPYLAVLADERVQVPREFVKNGEIVLNISPDATSGLKIGNEWIEFKARFNGGLSVLHRAVFCLAPPGRSGGADASHRFVGAQCRGVYCGTGAVGHDGHRTHRPRIDLTNRHGRTDVDHRHGGVDFG